ncbi:dihydrodipicolinate synthase family protein [Fodinibius salsisoli]|uniref:Dihydrodipicolinate synthase family protein n=1 Tax=Fodinibius salsisoli TaxID=2820877 RepID=A0ABT3PSH7_9BACT|nr:dihydrodipicolinate synthase family protein [Fodinibius salsisoli]MCW9708823.1 dihydrodipicolinate synthase family protein [Fodinibius salsisoli]
MSNQKIKGLVAAPFTPMNENRSINLSLIPKLYERFQQNDVIGVFINGSTSEGLSLTTNERKALTEAWNEVIDDGFKLLVHVGHTSIEDAKNLARHATDLKSVSGISTVGPFYQKPDSTKELVEFCREIATEAPEVPFYYYHIPPITAVNFPMHDFLSLASDEIPTLAGIKFSNHDYVDFSQCLEFQDERFDIMFGNDELLSCGLMLGAHGFVGSTYNLFPELYHKIFEAFEEDNLKRVQHLQRKSMEYVQTIDEYGGYNGAAKGVMKLLGIDCGPARLPLKTPSNGQLDKLEVALRKKGFFKYTQKR